MVTVITKQKKQKSMCLYAAQVVAAVMIDWSNRILISHALNLNVYGNCYGMSDDENEIKW